MEGEDWTKPRARNASDHRGMGRGKSTIDVHMLFVFAASIVPWTGTNAAQPGSFSTADQASRHAVARTLAGPTVASNADAQRLLYLDAMDGAGNSHLEHRNLNVAQRICFLRAWLRLHATSRL